MVGNPQDVVEIGNPLILGEVIECVFVERVP